MADPVSIIGFATLGLKLSFTLYSFAAALGSAGKEMRQTAKDLSLFSSVLKQLGIKMDEAHKAGFVADDAFDLTREIIAECRSLFDELEALIDKATVTEKVRVIKMGKDEFDVKVEDREKMTVSFGRRLLLLFQKSEILDQRARLESLKSSLQLMLSVLTFTERARVFTADKGHGSAERETWASEEKLELEALVLANQAATSEFRKLKTKPLLNRKTNLDGDIIANFGLVGQLSSSKDGHPTPNESIPYPTPQVMNSKPTVEVDSTPVPSWPKSTYLSRMRGSTIEPDAMVVVVPPALSYTSSGHIVPYHSAIPTTNVVEAGYRQQQEATTANKATAHSSTTQTSTPGAVFDMLINQ